MKSYVDFVHLVEHLDSIVSRTSAHDSERPAEPHAGAEAQALRFLLDWSARNRERGGARWADTYVTCVVTFTILPWVTRKTVLRSGTPFEKLPEDWVCPLCGVGKDAFTAE